MDTLSDGTLKAVLSQLGGSDPRERARVACVCRRWNNLILSTPSWWEELVIPFVEVFPEDEQFQWRSQRSMRIAKKVSRLSADKLSRVFSTIDESQLEELLATLSSSSPHLVSLTVIINEEVSNFERLRSWALASCPSLKELRLFVDLCDDRAAFNVNVTPARYPCPCDGWSRESSDSKRPDALFRYGDDCYTEIPENELKYFSQVQCLKIELDQHSSVTSTSLLQQAARSLECFSGMLRVRNSHTEEVPALEMSRLKRIAWEPGFAAFNCPEVVEMEGLPSQIKSWVDAGNENLVGIKAVIQGCQRRSVAESEESHLMNVLRSSPHLQVLYLQDNRGQDEAPVDLDRWVRVLKKSRAICPKLKEITLGGYMSTPMPDLVELVKSREKSKCCSSIKLCFETSWSEGDYKRYQSAVEDYDAGYRTKHKEVNHWDAGYVW